jgi:(1->4)-alpha-D-glucan 1-alpha-D-glucosylmutase
MHGYDIADPRRLNEELGTEDDFDRLIEHLHRHNMGLLLDIVPNHMAASPENPWWMDVLESGRESHYGSFFDIDWDSPGSKFPELQEGQVVIPFLTDLYDKVLADQRIALRLDSKGLFFEAEGNRFPIRSESYLAVLDACIAILRESTRADGDALQRLSAVRTALDGEKPDSIVFKTELWSLYQKSEEIHNAIDHALRMFNGEQGNATSFERLDSLLCEQHYRLAFWRTAVGEVNYRRFFGLNDLVCVRIEDPTVFSERHSRTLEMIHQDKVDGLRIDHIDGLADPLEYLRRLQRTRAITDDEDSTALNIYTIVEKITSGTESLPSDWPTAGTTGYDFLNAVNTLFVDPAGSRDLETSYREFTGIRSSFTETWSVRKRQVIEELFAADVRMLSSRLGRLAVLSRFGRDIPMHELVRGLKEITASLPIYRTYCRDLNLSQRDREYLQRAFKFARERAPVATVSDAAFDFLRQVFLLEPSVDLPQHKEVWLNFLMRWQQFTGAVMAKGLEDTAFFVHHGLISLNEVGCNPLRKEIRFGISAFHDYNEKTFRKYPFTLNATSTHDTKWSEDLRARINVLSEMPGEWKSRLAHWAELNQAKKKMLDGRVVPSPNEEVLLYQSMLGVWPLQESWDDPVRARLRQRIETFILKAAREAKTHSSWVSPHEAHENALREFISAIFESSAQDPFVADFRAFLERIGRYGACNGFSQVLLKITSPGVPDFYQGNELWNEQLTDPDNRSAVDFNLRIQVLEEMTRTCSVPCVSACVEMLTNWRDGRLKLYLTKEALHFRRSHRDLFLRGEYLPLESPGDHRESVCSFARHFEDEWSITVVPRLVTKLGGEMAFPLGGTAWGTSALMLPGSSPANWINVFTGESLSASVSRRKKRLPLAEIFSNLPFALLQHVPDPQSQH